MAHLDKIALVTGAGRTQGIGFETASQLAAQGFTILLTARRLADAQSRAADLSARGYQVTGYALDVTDPAAATALAKSVEKQYGRLDVLINNAATTSSYGERPSTADLTAARASLETILFGAWQVSNAFLPLLRRSKHPRLVNVSSGAGSHADQVFGMTTANQMGASYAIAKAALNALTVKQAVEERTHAVLVNAVCPGFTATFEGGEAMGARPVSDGAASVVWAALLPDDGPTGGFFRDGKPLGW